jgi:hypothetical protein
MSMTELPKELRSTRELLDRAFPDGPSDAEMMPLVRVLYDHMGDRQLSIVLAHLIGEPPEVALNTVCQAASLDIETPQAKSVLAKLESAGFREWSEADE